MRLTVHLFAAARERAGASTIEVELATEPPTVASLLSVLATARPALASLLPHVRVAVDQEFATPGTPLTERSEVALIPPVAGGSPLFRVQSEPLVLQAAIDAVSRHSHGGLVTFTGVVRDLSHGERITRLDYEAYAPMAEKKLAEIGLEAQTQWPGVEVAVVHRVGTLAPGDLAVVIAVSAPHRKEAFRACEFVIDRLKQDVPIWKKELGESGAVWVGLGP